MSAHVKINLAANGVGSLDVDGINIANSTRGFTIKAPKVGQPIVLELDMMIWEALDIELDATITVPDATRDALIALGWTPPEDE